MRKLLIVAFVSGLTGFVLGNAFWYLASPLWIDTVVSEAAPTITTTTAEVIASGEVDGVDFVHQGEGIATVIQTDAGRVLRFEDFEVTNGPALKVWLVAHDNPRSNGDVTDNEWISLGDLKGSVGDQNYTIPDEVDLSVYRSVVIWCEPFGVLFAGAPLAPTS